MRIERTGEPRRLRRLSEGGAIYRVPLNQGPSRVWRRLFLEQKEYTLDFIPALVRFTYYPPAANFQAEERELEQRLRLLDTWIENTNRRCGRSSRRHAREAGGEKAKLLGSNESSEGVGGKT